MTRSDDLPARDAIIEKLRSRLDQLRHSTGDRPTPVTTLTYAQSIDGCIAPFGGGTMQLSGQESQKLTHQIRALHDTILVGINTVLCDDPRLTVRLVKGKNPQPVIVDSRLRFPLEARLLRDPCVRPIIATGQGACKDKANRLIDAGAQVIRVPSHEDGLIDLMGLLTQLKQMGFHSVMVEGGAKIITSMLVSQMADQLLLAIALRFVGGLRAVNPVRAWDQMPQLGNVHCQLLAGDLVVWGHLEKNTNCVPDPYHLLQRSRQIRHQLENGGKKSTMSIEGLVLGLLDISTEINDPVVAAKYRGFTIAWSRYGYRDEIIEASTVDEILQQAVQRNHRWCLILTYGQIIKEHWSPEHWKSQDLFSALKSWVAQSDFLVAGALVGNSTTWFGFEHRCLMVNLKKYRQLSAPSFDVACDRSITLPKATPLMKGARIAALNPAAETEVQRPVLPGWNLIAASLTAGLPVPALSEDLLGGMLNLTPTCPSRTQAFAQYLDDGLTHYRSEDQNDDLSPDQVCFLNDVKAQTANSRHGVFLWNIESYEDIETPREDFRPPVSSLYSVAAGFKPNRMLHTHGFDDTTRVVFFDYSARALEIRKYLVQEWNGEDFPDFVRHIFRVFPHPETFYQLWHNVTPADVKWADIEQMWERELKRWNGARVFRDHWQSYRELQHEFVCCNILTDAAALLDQLAEESNDLIWWSNAFFTVYGNWFYTVDQRKKTYDDWIKRLATINPKLFLFGSDYNNVNVNSVRAAEYWELYQRGENNCLVPCRLFETEIRM